MRLKKLLAAFLLIPALAIGQAQADDASKAAWEKVVLRGGNTLQGQIIKKTDVDIFLDVGYTILRIPRASIDLITTVVESKDPGGAKSARKADSIFFTSRLNAGTIEEKARDVAEGVVQVLCLSKSGSGFIINRKEGYVVTNYHVIEQERDISLMIYVKEKKGLRKEKLSDIRIVAFNPFFDLALLKIENPEKIPLRETYLGDYSRVKLGDPVFAIGNPLGLDRTVSDGIVSNRSRALGGKLSIQTTAAINPGNSGGPLFNIRGEVIGVTSSKIMGGESLGFAIPIHYVKDFLRNREAFAFDKDNPNTGFRYLKPPPKSQAVKKKK
ncbi:MAG: trypsin-like peptidase domain-containing protein [Planctomycetota bacterium]